MTLIGLVKTVEGTSANIFGERKYNFNMSTDRFPVQPTFWPCPGIIDGLLPGLGQVLLM